MNPNAKPSDIFTEVGVIDPDVYTAGSGYSTGWIAAKDFFSFLAVVFAGTLGASATVDAKLEEAQDSGGTGVQDLPAKAITQLTKAGSDDDKQRMINLRQAELSAGFTHFRLTISPGVADCDLAGAVFGLAGRYEPAAGLASVDEIVG
jgi:hypothetical protein